ncbi:MAG TPA: hypothetical protein VN607_09300 [Gemmatimonadaceae bacterium]|nr:hypothetical protein [Gemmatimonadaceae bacterium]
MSAAAFTLQFDNTSDTTFRAWASAIDTQILAMGWVHSTDTGQANLATMTRTTTAGTNYIIYKTNDGLTPIFLKIEFVSGGTATTPGFGASVGWATDGAGHLTGTLISSVWSCSVFGSQSSDTTSRACIVSGSAGRLALALNQNATITFNTIVLSVERSKDATGADTADALIFTMAVGGTSNALVVGGTPSSCAQHYIPSTGTSVPSVDLLIPAILSNAASGSGAYGTTIGAGIPIPLAGSAQNPGTNILAVLNADYPTGGSTATIAVYGTNHTYFSVGSNITRVIGVGGTVTTLGRLFVRDD